jgi:hypothetical protein
MQPRDVDVDLRLMDANIAGQPARNHFADTFGRGFEWAGIEQAQVNRDQRRCSEELDVDTWALTEITSLSDAENTT